MQTPDGADDASSGPGVGALQVLPGPPEVDCADAGDKQPHHRSGKS